MTDLILPSVQVAIDDTHKHGKKKEIRNSSQTVVN